MEYVSVLAGERWSDSPRCTDPVLAAVARTVNDFVDWGTRRQLAAEALRLVDARADDPSLSPRLVLLCTSYAVANSRMKRYVLRPALWHTRHALRASLRTRARRPAPLRWLAAATFNTLAVNVYAPLAVRLLARRVSPDELVQVVRDCLTLVAPQRLTSSPTVAGRWSGNVTVRGGSVSA
jgi:hypothetical protein